MKKVILVEDVSGSLGYYIDRPGKFIHDVAFSLKLAWERALYGWDRTATWSVDWWLSNTLPDILEDMKNDKQGVQGEFLDTLPDGSLDESPEGWKRAQAKQNECIDGIIEGFQAAKRLLGFDERTLHYTDEQRRLQEQEDQEKFHKGMKLLEEHFFSLWT